MRHRHTQIEREQERMRQREREIERDREKQRGGRLHAGNTTLDSILGLHDPTLGRMWLQTTEPLQLPSPLFLMDNFARWSIYGWQYFFLALWLYHPTFSWLVRFVVRTVGQLSQLVSLYITISLSLDVLRRSLGHWFLSFITECWRRSFEP